MGVTRSQLLEEPLSLAIEEKYDRVRTLIAMGKERGYLLYDEVNDILPAEVHSSEEIEDLLSTFERYGIDIYEGASEAKSARAELKVAEPVEAEAKEEIVGGSEEVELDLTLGVLERTNDPVRMYLREMGTVPLLKRAGEVAIATLGRGHQPQPEETYGVNPEDAHPARGKDHQDALRNGRW
jgi:RNA polymerase primary sigma factor